MTDRLVIVTQPEDGVVEAVLNRPDKLNAITPELMRAIADAQAEIAAMENVSCVVLRGEGRAFCAGLDKSGFERMKSTGAGSLGMDIMDRTHGPANVAQNACWGWRMLNVPVVCALQGFALGGGFQICLGADIRIAAPGTRKLTYTAEVFEADAAHDYGFVTEIAEDPLARARELAREIAGKSPSALRSAKELLNIADEEGGALEPLLAESRLQKALIGKPHQLEAIAAGMEGRPAKFG